MQERTRGTRREEIKRETSHYWANAEEEIYVSTDGARFTQIGTIKDADSTGGLCCGTLYEPL